MVNVGMVMVKSILFRLHRRGVSLPRSGFGTGAKRERTNTLSPQGRVRDAGYILPKPADCKAPGRPRASPAPGVSP